MTGKVPSTLVTRSSVQDSLDDYSPLTCSICLEMVNTDTSYLQVHSSLSLGHIFHRQCILQWQNEAKLQATLTGSDVTFNCPLCRRSITPIPSSAPSSRPNSREGQSQSITNLERSANLVEVVRNRRTIMPIELSHTRTPSGSRTFVIRFGPLD